jgi:hypothetical protein
MIITDDWCGLYSTSWKKDIVPEAYSHPAKFNRGLIAHIYKHMIAEGWLHPGDVIVDPFGGVALGALDAMRYGMTWHGVELEPRFVQLGNQNIEFWNTRYGAALPGWGTARLIQGDSRRLLEVIAEAGACVSSPPFSQSGVTDHDGQTDALKGKFTGGGDSFLFNYSYGSTPGNLGNMRGTAAGLSAAVSSPPFGESEPVQDTEWFKQHREEMGRNSAAAGGTPGHYGTTPGNLGNMRGTAAGLSVAVSSPPYADGCAHTGGDDPKPEHIEGGEYHGIGLAGAISSPPYAETAVEKNSTGINIEKQWQTYRAQGGGMSLDAFKAQQERHSHDYGNSLGQLGAMKAAGFEGAVSSPPWLQTGRGCKSINGDDALMARHAASNMNVGFGKTDGQLTNADNFWEAARQIVDQVYAALAPGAHAVWVVKAFVKNKQRVDFPGQWRQMCEAAGFQTLHEHRAWLVENRGAQHTLEGELLEKKVERKSFFRRLAENKGSPRIDYEVVYCMVKRHESHC